jgi:hypothetical protein
MSQINPDSIFNALQGFSALCTVYILLLTQKTNNRALVTARQNLEANILLKQMDVYNACSVRYEQIGAESHKLCKIRIDEKDGLAFYLRFWELQHNQFVFFQRGYIDTLIMISWMNWRKDEFLANAPLSVENSLINYQWGWKNVSERFKNTEFRNFIEEVHSGDPAKVVHQSVIDYHHLRSPFMSSSSTDSSPKGGRIR